MDEDRSELTRPGADTVAYHSELVRKNIAGMMYVVKLGPKVNAIWWRSYIEIVTAAPACWNAMRTVPRAMKSAARRQGKLMRKG